MKSFQSSAIVNVARIEIITDETAPRVLTFDSVSSAELEPFVSKGEETELRVKNRILAQDCLEDIIKGYNIKLKDCALSRELLALIDGGSAINAGDTAFSGYDAPAAGQVSARTRFTLCVYSEEKDYGGETTSVFRFIFPNCVGTPCSMSFENGVFAAPEYTVRSRSSRSYAMKIQQLDRMPLVCANSNQAPAQPSAGDCLIASAAITIGELALAAGDLAYYDGDGWIKITDETE